MVGVLNEYDEFGLLEENASEAGLPRNGPPVVSRHHIAVENDRELSALLWGTESPELVFLHGGGQNAHTWDTVALALDRPLLAIDLAGHGHSDWRPEHEYSPPLLAADVARAIRQLAPDAKMVVGMSMGGLTAICLASEWPELVPKLAIIDVTPGTDNKKARSIVEFISGPEVFESFEAIFERTVKYNPTRSLSSLRRGILHNAASNADGSWSWRYDPVRRFSGAEASHSSLWEQISQIRCPVLLALGSKSPVVGAEDVREFKRRQPGTQIVEFEGAGHSIQGDRPGELARSLESYMVA